MNKYAYSLDGELYDGPFDSPEEAAAECFASYDVDECEVSEMIIPTPPEDLIDADNLLEQVQCSEDYEHDFAEDWPDVKQEIKDELTRDIQEVFGKWLDKYKLRPTWFLCNDPITYRKEDFKWIN